MPTKIEWTDEVWNPAIGCSKCSPGCQNCYAERFAYRLACMGQEKYQKVVKGMPTSKPFWKKGFTAVWTGEIFCDKSILVKPLHWRKPRRIFLCSMGDLFHEKVPFEFIEKIFCVIRQCPQHTFLILTKRPEMMAEYIEGEWCREDSSMGFGSIIMTEEFPNIYLGISVSTQKEADEKRPILLQIPAAKRFVSIEPMLGEIDLNLQKDYDPIGGLRTYGDMLDWVIIGAESGPRKRYCPIENIRSVVQQCQAAGVPVFVKQIHIPKLPKGNWWVDCPKAYHKHQGVLVEQCGFVVCKDMNNWQWPEDLQVQEFP